MSEFVKPQSPLYSKENDAYFYPMTTVDQVVMEDGTRLNTKIDEISNITPENIGAVNNANVVNNFTTTEEGYVADARAVAMLNDKLASPSEFYEYDWSNCMVRITRYGKIRFANIYIDTKVEAASTLGTLLEIDRPAYEIKSAQWVPKADNSAFGSRVITIKTDGQISIDADAWRGGFSIMYVVP